MSTETMETSCNGLILVQLAEVPSILLFGWISIFSLVEIRKMVYLITVPDLRN